MKKIIVLVLASILLVGCSTTENSNEIIPIPSFTATAAAKPTPTAKVEVKLEDKIMDEVNSRIEKYNKRSENKFMGLAKNLSPLDETIKPVLVLENESTQEYTVAIDELFMYYVSYNKKNNDVYDANISVDMNKVIANAEVKFQEESAILRELNTYISNYEIALYGTGFVTLGEVVEVNKNNYAPIINFNNKVEIKSMEDLYWFYEQGYVWDKKEEIIQKIFGPSSTNFPAMIIDYEGYPYRYQCECGLYPMSWIDINPSAIISVENRDDGTKKIEVAGKHKGEASAVENSAFIQVVVKNEDNKWKVVSVQSVWL